MRVPHAVSMFAHRRGAGPAFARCRRSLLALFVASLLFGAGAVASADCLDYSEHLHWIASVPDPGGIMGVVVKGDLAFAAASDSGLYVVDISDSMHPRRVARADTPGSASDIAIQGEYAFIADLFGGLQVISIANPLHPVRVGGVATSLPAVSVAVRGNAVLVGEARVPYFASSKLEVYDVSIPSAPELATVMTTPSWVWDIALAGNSAYLALEERGLMRVDITDPFDPGPDGLLALPGYAEGIAVDGENIFVGDGPGGVQVVRSLPGQPLQVIGSVATLGEPNGVAMYGRYVCIADGMEGFTVADVTDPTAPVVVGNLATTYTCWNIVVQGSTAYVADQYALEVLELGTDPSNVTSSAFAYGIADADVAVRDSVAYVTCIEPGLRTFDISDPMNPVDLGSLELTGTAEAIEVMDNHVYVATWQTGISIVDVTNPAAPFLTAALPISGPTWDIDVAGSHAYVAANDLYVVDISDAYHPVVVGSVHTSSGRRARRVRVQGNYAYVSDEAMGLAIVDVTVPTAPAVVRSVSIPLGAYAVGVSGTTAYVTGKDSGFYTVAISDPGQAHAAGSVFLNKIGNRVTVDGRYAYVTTGLDPGVFLIDGVDPSDPRVIGEMLTAGVSQGSAIQGEWIFVADQPYFTVAPAHCPSPLSQVETDEGWDPRRPSLNLQAAPNPSSGSVRVMLDPMGGGEIRIAIHDPSGRVVRHLYDGQAPRARSFFEWNGRDDGGRIAPSGTYFARVATSKGTAATRLLIIR
jgi:hypothetical protein